MLTLLDLLIIGVVLVAALVAWAWREARRHGTGTGEELAGICASALQTSSQKEARKQEILTMLGEKAEISNAEVRRALGVSSRSAVRYLDELEHEGKVVQVGRAGHAVTYRLQ
jgi:predicted HTH transcriptional regulator